MTTIIHQPNDKLFKQAMPDIRVAREFFETHLPPAILHKVDLHTLKLEKHSFIDEMYKGSEADVVYSVKVGDSLGYFYLLCENQSQVDNQIAFRLLSYTVRLMELVLKQQPESPLPIVYHMVLYTGEKQWDAAKDIFELFGDQETLARQILFQPYTLIDVQRMSDEELTQHLWSGMVEFALKYRTMRDFA